MTKREKTLLSLSTAFALIFGIVPVSHGMHIMEGYLPLTHCLIGGGCFDSIRCSRYYQN